MKISPGPWWPCFLMIEFNRLSDATVYDCINIIYPFIKPVLDKRTSLLWEYGDFNKNVYMLMHIETLLRSI